MKSKKLVKNLLFVFLTVSIIVGICLFNYNMDPYNLLKNKHYMIFPNNQPELIYIILKSYKDYKSDTVVIGGSDGASLFDEHFQDYFNNISIEGINFYQYKKILDNYLKIHPETKKVIILASYINIINEIDLFVLPEFDGIEYSLKDYQRLFFSLEATIDSFLLLKNHFTHKYIIKNLPEEENRGFYIEYKPKQLDKYEGSIEDLKELENKNFKIIDSLIKMLDEKNIDYVFIIPPYNGIYLASIYENKHFQNNVDNFRRYLVSIVPEDKKIYDFAFVNKYTSSDISENKDALYINLSHPSIIYGAKVFKVLQNDKKADNSIYFLLNKDNVESVINKENKLIKDFIKNNRKTIEYYFDLREKQKAEDILFCKNIYEDSFSDNSKQEMNYLREINN